MIDIATLQSETQAQIDDASQDYLYVGNAPVVEMPGALVLLMDLGASEAASKVSTLQFAVVSSCKVWRANGRVGAARVRFEQTVNGLVGSWSAWTSAAQAFEAQRT